MKNFDFKKVLPHLGVLALFVVISFAYLSPLIEGKKVAQSDLIQFKGMSKSVSDYREKTGEEALWADNMFSGMPAYQISTYYPGNLIRRVDRAIRLFLPRPADYLFLLMAGFYFLGIVLGLRWWEALLGAFAMAFSSYSVIIIEAGHTSKVHAIAYMAPVLASIILAYRGKILLGSALTAFFLALQLSANHLQITYYLLITIVIMVIAKFIHAIRAGEMQGFIKTSLVLVVAGFIGIGPNIGNLWTTQEYGKYTMRGPSELTIHASESDGLDKDYALRWSYGRTETYTLLVPNFFGGSSQDRWTDESEVYQAMRDNLQASQAKEILRGLPARYWGDQPFTSGPVYVGAIICFLFVLGLLLVRSEDKWWLLIATIVSILFAWGRHFPLLTDVIFDYLPLYNKFRAVSMTLVIAQVAMPFLALLALKNFFSGDISKDELKKKTLMALGIVGGVLLLMVALPTLFSDFEHQFDEQMRAGGYPDWLVDAIVSDRISLMRSDAFRSLGFILVAAGVMWLFILDKLKSQWAMVILAALVLIDLWAVDKRYLNEDDFVKPRNLDAMYTETQADQQILQDSDPNFRVYNTVEPLDRGARTSYYHKNIGGYHGAKLKRYQELIDYQIGRGNLEVIDMLNTKYFIRQGGQGGLFAMPNPGVLGNAWFVQNYKLVANPDAELNNLSDMYEVRSINNDYTYVNGKAIKVDTIGVLDELYLSTKGYEDLPTGEGERRAGYEVDFSILNVPNGIVAVLGSSDSADIVIDTTKARSGIVLPEHVSFKLISEFEAQNMAVIDKRFANDLTGFSLQFDSTANIQLTKYKPNELTYKSKTASEQLAVFSEVYYDKGWKAYVDGKEQPYFRANYILRAMKIPAGEHEIVFKFEPRAYYMGNKLGLIFSVILLGFIAYAFYSEYKEMKPDED